MEQGISAGFPSPADDFKEIRISLDKELVKNGDATLCESKWRFNDKCRTKRWRFNCD